MQNANWDLVHEYGERGECKVFIDRGSIVENDDVIKAMFKHYLVPPGTDKRNQKLISEVYMPQEFDTSKNLVRMLEITFRYVDGTPNETLDVVQANWAEVEKGNLVELNYLKKRTATGYRKWWVPFSLTTTYYGITAPRKISTFIRGKAKDLEAENPGFGVSIPYSTSGRLKATVYIYDLGASMIPEGPMSTLVRDHFDQTIEEVSTAVSQGMYESTRTKKIYLTGAAESGHDFLCAEIEIRENGSLLDSYIFVTGRNGKFVKIRITAPAAEQATKAARDFADKFARVLWPQGRKN